MLKQSLNSSRVFLKSQRIWLFLRSRKKLRKQRQKILMILQIRMMERQERQTPIRKKGRIVKTKRKWMKGCLQQRNWNRWKRKLLMSKSKDEKKVDEGLFTAKELESLEKKIADVEKWRDEKVEEQEKMPLSEMPKLTVSLIKSKIQDLDSEVQLLIGKARMIRAERERAKRKAEEEKKDKKKKKKEKDSTKSEEEKEESKESDP